MINKKKRFRYWKNVDFKILKFLQKPNIIISWLNLLLYYKINAEWNSSCSCDKIFNSDCLIYNHILKFGM